MRSRTLRGKLPKDPKVREAFARFAADLFDGKISSFAVVVKRADGSGEIIAEGRDSNPDNLHELKPLVEKLMPMTGMMIVQRMNMDASKFPNGAPGKAEA